MSKKIIYHGSNVIVEKPKVIVGNYTKDFSWGFYCTQNLGQAKKWAISRAGIHDPGCVSCYEYDTSIDVKLQIFKGVTDEWLDFIAYCRNGGEHDFDIVVGPMADDQIWDHVNAFLRKDMTRERFMELARFKHTTDQISFHTEKAFSTLTFKQGVKVYDKHFKK